MTAVDVDLEKTPKLFAVALYASAKGNPEIAPWAVFTTSDDEARRLGMDRALELWPTSKGWVVHTASVVEIVLRYDNS